MAPRWIDPPNTPAPRSPAPWPPRSRALASQPLKSQPVAPQPPRSQIVPAGQPNGATGRPRSARGNSRGPGTNEAAPSRDAKAAGQPQASGSRLARVMRPPNRSDGDGSHDPGLASTRQLLFEFTKPSDGLPPPRSAEMVAILQDLIDLLPTLDDGSLGALAGDALREEIARHRALIVRGHEG